jgi:hypothetical protein
MKFCLSCNTKVENFKSNSHFIPRLITKRSKENGKNVLINAKKSLLKEKNQEDPKSDFICSSCEFFFENDIETPASKILLKKEKNFLSYIKSKNMNIYYLDNKESIILIWKFFASILVRYHIYQKVIKNKSYLPSKHFKKLNTLIKDTDPDITLYPMFIQILEPFTNDSSYKYPHPRPIKNINHHEIAGAGFNCVIKTDDRENSFLDKVLFTKEKIYIICTSDIMFTGKNMKEDTLKFIHSKKKLNKKNN